MMDQSAFKLNSSKNFVLNDGSLEIFAIYIHAFRIVWSVQRGHIYNEVTVFALI